MIVAITGGAGFIGRRLVSRHLALGDEVRMLSRRAPVESELYSSIKWCCGDLTTIKGDLQPFVDQADVLYHCAGEIRDEACLLYTSPSPRDKRQSRMPSSA